MKGTQQDSLQVQVARIAELPVPAGRLHSGHDAHAKETEFRHAEGREGAPYERL